MSKIHCNLCFSSFDEKKYFIKHLKTDHCRQEGVHLLECPYKNCNGKFTLFKTLSTHLGLCKNVNNEMNEIVEQVSCIQINEESQSFSYQNNSHELYVSDEIPFTIGCESTDEIQLQFSGDQSAKHMCDFLMNVFAKNIDSLSLNDTAVNVIYKNTEKLIEELNVFFTNSLQNHSSAKPVEVLSAASNLVLNKVKCLDSDFKRNKKIESQPNYIRPQEICIGVGWKNVKTNGALDVQQHRKTFFYVSILEQLEALFSQDYIEKLYFEYNDEKKHQCKNDLFMDYCCGNMFKKNQLFTDQPDGLQLQLFVDGFEVCDPLKPKANKHSQIAFYFTIRNMPTELAFNQENIHFVCLCNANNLKSDHTGYNDIWEKIVSEIKILESVGLNVSGKILKGKH